MPTSNERKMLSSNEALKELTDQITVIGIKLVYKHQYLQTLCLKSHNFHPLEIVGHDSETQLQVCEKFNDLF